MVTERQASKNRLYDQEEDIVDYRAGAIGRKQQAYWIGFLEGAQSSGRIEAGEPEALEAEARKFINFFNCPDSRDMLEDLISGCFSDSADMIVSINELSQEVRSKAEVNSPWLEVDYLNEFLGFCGGVICDGLLLPKEAQAIHQRFLDQPALANAATLELLRNALAEALADNVLTENELRNVHSWLARLVGDGFSDTGLPNLGNVSNIASDASHNTPIEFAGRRFVLTGKMRIGERAEIANMIEAAGGTFDDRPTRKTDYVVVSTEASVLWRTTHFGTKLEKAKKLLDQGYPLRVVSETMLEAGLKRVLSAL